MRPGMSVSSDTHERALEGHFACAPGLLVSIECLGHSYITRTDSHEMSVSLPTLTRDWQQGFLGRPAWTYRTFRNTERNAEIDDANFEWGVTAGFHDEPDGTQAPDYARLRRWRFETTIKTTKFVSDFGNARAKFVRELEAWWSLASSWISIFTKQDSVQIGKAGTGIRVGPIVMWCGDESGWRVNPSVETSRSLTNDQGAVSLDHATLKGCMTLTANATKPPDEWAFIRDARALVKAQQFRRAVIDAGTAAELAMTSLIDPTLTGMNLLQRERIFEKNRGLWELSNLMVERNAGTRPVRLQQDLAEPRNKAAHDGAALNEAKANAAVAVATDLVEQLHPLAGLLP